LALTTSAIDNIRNFRKYKKGTSLEHELIKSVDWLTYRLFSKKGNLKESLVTFDDRRKKSLVENLKKLKSMFNTV